jgi:hypothetical protein
VISAAVFALFQFGIMFSFFCICAASFSAKLPIRYLYRGSGFILFMTRTMLVFHSASWEPLGFLDVGFHEGMSFALGLLAAFTRRASFLSVTTMPQRKESLDGRVLSFWRLYALFPLLFWALR